MDIEELKKLTKDDNIDNDCKYFLQKIIRYSIQDEIETKKFFANLAKKEVSRLFSKIDQMSNHDAKNFLFVLISNHPDRVNFSNYEDHEIKDLIKIYLTNSEDPLLLFYNIQFFKSNCLLGETYFEWIEDNPRLIIFIAANFPIEAHNCFYSINELKEYVMYNLTYKAFTFSENHARSWGVNSADSWKVNFSYVDYNGTYGKQSKIKAMMRLRRYYFDLESNRKHISFLDNLDEEDLDWLIEYLKEKNHLQLVNYYRPSVKYEKLALIQASLDLVNPFNTIQYELIKSDANKEDPSTDSKTENIQTKTIRPREKLISQIIKAYERRHARMLESESKKIRTEVIDVKNWKKLIKIASHQESTNRKAINKLIEREFERINAEN